MATSRFNDYRRAGTKKAAINPINKRRGGIVNPRPVRMTEEEMNRYREEAKQQKIRDENKRAAINLSVEKETREEFETRRRIFRTTEIVGALQRNPNITFLAMRKILPTVTRKELEELVDSGTIKKYVLINKKTVFGIN